MEPIVDAAELGPYGNGRLPEGIRTWLVPNVNGMSMHVLEAGVPGDPVVLLVHGFPELAYSWRNQIVPLAAAGYHVLAPDLRGFGRTTGWDARYETDLRSTASSTRRGPARIALGVGPPLGLGHRGPRSWRSVCVVGAIATTRRVPIGGHHEWSVHGNVSSPLQHRRRRGAGRAAHVCPTWLGSWLRFLTSSPALHGLQPDAGGDRRLGAPGAGHARLLPGLLPREERGLGRKRSPPARRSHGHRVREASSLLRARRRHDHLGDSGPDDAVARRSCRVLLAHRRRRRCAHHRVRPDRVPGRARTLRTGCSRIRRTSPRR